MTVSEMMAEIGYATLEVLVVTSVGRLGSYFDTDHVSEEKDFFYMEDADGRPFELKKNSQVKVVDEGYEVQQGDCVFLIKLSK